MDLGGSERFAQGVIYLQICCMGLTVLVDFFTGFMYILTWRSQSLSGRAFAHMLINRSCHFIVYGISDAGSRNNWPPSACIFLGFLHHMFWLSEYSWLITVNYDFWKTFRHLTPVQTSEEKSRQYRRYSLFAWGVPLLVVTFSIGTYFVLKRLKTHEAIDKFIPDYGSCWVGRSAVLIYVIPIVSVFVITSLVYAILAYRALQKQRNDTETARLAKDKKNNTSSFGLFWKLSILMGINWFIEFAIGISLFLTVNYDHERDGTNKKFYLVHLLAGLVLIFYMLASAITISIMFVFKNKRMISLIYEELARYSVLIQCGQPGVGQRKPNFSSQLVNSQL